jgi:hypothetical protein
LKTYKCTHCGSQQVLHRSEAGGEQRSVRGPDPIAKTEDCIRAGGERPADDRNDRTLTVIVQDLAGSVLIDKVRFADKKAAAWLAVAAAPPR